MRDIRRSLWASLAAGAATALVAGPLLIANAVPASAPEPARLTA